MSTSRRTLVHESFCLLDFRNLQAREGKQDHLKELFRRLMGCPRCSYWSPVKEESVYFSLEGFKRRIVSVGGALSLFLGFLLFFKLLFASDLLVGGECSGNALLSFNVVKHLYCFHGNIHLCDLNPYLLLSITLFRFL